MAKVIYNYRYKCIDENTIVSDDLRKSTAGPPTTCKNNNTHIIDTSTIRIVEEISENITQITEVNSSTHGTYRYDPITVYGNPGINSVTETLHTWNYDVSIVNVGYDASTDNVGDELSFYISPPNNGLIGIITSSVSPGNTIIYVNSTVITTVYPGLTIIIHDISNDDYMGEIIDVDPINGTITTSSAAVHSFVVGSEVLLRIPRLGHLQNFKIVRTGEKNMGAFKIGSSDLPKGYVVHVQYINKSTTSKTLQAFAEVLF